MQIKIFVVKTQRARRKRCTIDCFKVENESYSHIRALLCTRHIKRIRVCEADGPHLVEEAILGLDMFDPNSWSCKLRRNRKIHCKKTSHEDLKKMTSSKSLVDRSKVCERNSQYSDKAKGEVTLELLEATFTSANHCTFRLCKISRKAK